MSSQVALCLWISLLAFGSQSGAVCLSCPWWVPHPSTCTFRALHCFCLLQCGHLGLISLPQFSDCDPSIPFLLSLPPFSLCLHHILSWPAKTCLLSLRWILGLLLNFLSVGIWHPLAIFEFYKVREHENHCSSGFLIWEPRQPQWESGLCFTYSD